MSNIYDIFNARKNGLDYLSEGFVPEEVEEVTLEGFEDPIEAMEEIIEESAEALIKLQSVSFMNELILENAMFDEFDEELLTEAVTDTIKEKGKQLVDHIKKLWGKITAWFKETIVNIQNFFTSGEKLVAKYKSDVPRMMKGSSVEVKVNEYRSPGQAIGMCEKMINNVKAAGEAKAESVADAKTKILKMAGATDRSGVSKTVRSAFIQTEKPVLKKLSDLDPAIVMDYVGNKKSILDSINKSKGNIDKEFKEILTIIQKSADGATGDNKSAANDAVTIFQFAINVKTSIINAMIACVKKGASDNKAILIKAIGGKKAGADLGGDDNAKPEVNADLKSRLDAKKKARRAEQSAAGKKKFAGLASAAKKARGLESFMFEGDDLEFVNEADEFDFEY